MRAVQELLEVVIDFDFASDVHRAAFLAALLTPLARYAFTGPAPLNLIDANVRGAGKSLMADAIAVILLGRPMARMAPTEDDAELRKRITAVARAGDLLVLIDNIAGALGGASLDAALTATEWQDRVLGTSDTWQGPLWATWYATGNNVLLTGDLSRRCLHIRLESREEHPERRQGFRHPELLRWVRQERPRLLRAALTILRAYCVAGRPEMRLPGWGAFEGWSHLIRGSVVWAGLPDPGETRRELQAEADPETAALGDLIAGWQELLESNPALGHSCTVRQALHMLETDSTGQQYERLRSALAELVPSASGQPLSPQRIGKVLRRFKGRIVRERALVSLPSTDKHGVRWSVQRRMPGRGDRGDRGDVSACSELDCATDIDHGRARNIPPIPPIPPEEESAPALEALTLDETQEKPNEQGQERNLNCSRRLDPSGNPDAEMDK